MAAPEKSRRGGARPGSGPKPYISPTGETRSKVVYVQVTPAEHARFIQLGGTEWLRSLLR